LNFKVPMVRIHKLENWRVMTSEQLRNEIGVLYKFIDPTNLQTRDEELNKLRAERGYKNYDEIKISRQAPEIEKKLEIFFTEHLHEDEEIRYILEGDGVFDIRDKSDQWIRIEVEKGDLIIVPAGLYHRFTLPSEYIHAMRLFTDTPKWTPINRVAKQI